MFSNGSSLKVTTISDCFSNFSMGGMLIVVVIVVVVVGSLSGSGGGGGGDDSSGGLSAGVVDVVQ